VEAIDRTKAERAAFDKDDAPEARRPTWVKVTRKRDSASTFWTVGKVYPVVSWDCGDPRCVSDDGSEKYIRTFEWEPCDAPAPCPPPVAGRWEARTLLDAARRILDSATRLSESATSTDGGGMHRVDSRALGALESDADDLRTALLRTSRGVS
jgi:hypothetical protein